MLSQHPLSLDPDFCYPFNETNYFSVCNCIVLPNIVCFRKFAFRLLKISIVEKKIDLQARAENQTKHPKKKLPKLHLLPQDSTHTFVHEQFPILGDSVLFRVTRDSARLGVLSDSRLRRLGDSANPAV